MSTDLRYLLSMSCVIPGLAGLYLYRKMQPRYHLLVYMMLADAAIETIVFTGKKNAWFKDIATVCSNAYMLIGFCLFLSFIKKNNYIKKKLWLCFLTAACLVAACNWYMAGSVYKDFFLTLCFATCISLFVSIEILSKQMTVINTRLKDNFWFWASCLFVVQKAYGLLTFGIFQFSLSDTPYGEKIGFFHTFVNVMYYCAFSIIMFIIPKRKSAIVNQNI
jgi:hypothetical protein